MIRWWKQWRRRRREEPITQRARELREFVYLDEVSVISLLSSRLGKLPSTTAALRYIHRAAPTP